MDTVKAEVAGVGTAAFFSVIVAAGVVVAILLTGCASQLEEAKLAGRAYRHAEPAATSGLMKVATPPSAYCKTVDDRHSLWVGIAAVSGALSGASGISVIPIPDDQEKLRLGVAAGVVVFGALAVTAAEMSGLAATAWARDCAEAP